MVLENGTTPPPENEFLSSVVSKSEKSVVWGGNYFSLPPKPGWLVWDKDNGNNGYADCELAWTNFDMAIRKFRYRWMGMLQENMAEKDVRYHPTQKPTSLCEWCLSFMPEAKTVLDAWMGSGTTLIAARNKGMRADGIEQDERYCKAAVERLRQGVLITV